MLGSIVMFERRRLRHEETSDGHCDGLQIMVVNTIMTTLAFFLPLALGECRPVPTDMDGWSPAGMASLKRLVTLNCHHHEYNEVKHNFATSASFRGADRMNSLVEEAYEV